ncbi:hypothetical protein LOY42_16160 [Pseudomonas sp. B21-023]|uniref:hypothetical protein n=1 Tax=Pseudomonas sp. B21-023 TaxID=2895477 RepID=UPI0021602864|nr:hypothetical protein [Pseudomonas sp. B21-023]UVM14828.1 hypothetical protein LOY42_16160 [Pseudomonas sp. B21-023]
MTGKRHGPSLRRELKFIIECTTCGGSGLFIGVFHQMDCPHCLGAGWLCGHSLKPLAASDIVPVLNSRLRDALAEIAKARELLGAGSSQGPERQYHENNRRGAGGTNYTGD